MRGGKSGWESLGFMGCAVPIIATISVEGWFCVFMQEGRLCFSQGSFSPASVAASQWLCCFLRAPQQWQCWLGSQSCSRGISQLSHHLQPWLQEMPELSCLLCWQCCPGRCSWGLSVTFPPLTGQGTELGVLLMWSMVAVVMLFCQEVFAGPAWIPFWRGKTCSMLGCCLVMVVGEWWKWDIINTITTAGSVFSISQSRGTDISSAETLCGWCSRAMCVPGQWYLLRTMQSMLVWYKHK